MKRRSSYKPTFLDREGPAGMHRVKVGAYAIIVFVLSAVMFAFLAYFLQLSGFFFIVFTLGCAATLGWAAAYVGMATGQAAADVAEFVTAGSGSSTPYQDQFSEEQALVMRREYGKAADLFEHRIAMNPSDPRVLMAAADLYATHAENPRRAAELYRQVQKLPEVGSGQDVYVSNKLADLYLGALKEPRRALVEFRRLIERYPGSVAANHAKLALENLKTDLMTDA